MELEDGDLFCGYCGAAVREQSVPEPSEDVPKRKKSKKAKTDTKSAGTPKKRTGLKVWLVFMLLAAMSGSALGFLAGRDIVDWRGWLPSDRLIWNSFDDGIAETVPEGTEDPTAGKDAQTEETGDGAGQTAPTE